MEVKMNNWHVIKSNTLIEASINLTTVEARILDLVFSDISSVPEVERDAYIQLDDMNEFKVYVADYIKAYESCELNNAYSTMKEASERLFSRYFTYYKESENFKEALEVHKTRWVYDIGYADNQAYITVKLNPIVIAMVGKLKTCFTQYNITHKAGLNGQYAYRLYDMCKQWQNKKYATEISLIELRQRFGLEEEQYKTMSNFKRVVLEPAVKQINESLASDITIKYEQKKVGKVITAFIFKVKAKKPPIEGTSKDITKNNEAIKNTWQKNGLTDKQIDKIAIYAEEFTTANSKFMSPSFRGGYKELIDSWRPMLKDPEKVNNFQKIQELLDRQATQ